MMTPDERREGERALRTLSPASFWFPMRSSVGSGWAEHAPFAFWLIDALRPRIVVELGTHMAYSFAAFCQAVQALGCDTTCYAIDTWKGDDHAGFYGDEIFDEVSAYVGDHYGSFARLIRSTFDDALPHFEPGTVDLLHIDGRHAYEDAKHDFSSWLPKLAASSVVLFHDINVRERDFGVHRLWNELRQSHDHFEFLHGNGLGVLGLGRELPAGVRELFELAKSPPAAQILRDIYCRLGRAVSHHHEIAFRGPDVVRALRGGIAERDDEIIRLRKERDALKQQAEGARNDAAMLLTQVNLANGHDRDSTIEFLRQDIESQKTTIRALQRSLEEAKLRHSEKAAGVR